MGSQTFNSGSGSFQIPASATNIVVEVWGAGGKGSTRTTTGYGGGGGGGAYSKKNTGWVAGTTYDYSVGAGATGTSPGGDTWFGSSSTCMAKGGNSVANNTATGATGGSGASGYGDLKYSGGNGASVSSGSTGSGGGSSAGTGSNGNNATTVTGASAPTGGGAGGNGGTNTNGTAGTAPGGGGGGCYRSSSTRTGGSGAAGRIVITWDDVPQLYYVIYTSEKGNPSAAQVKAGQDATGSAAVAAGQENARTTTGEQVFSAAASGLAAATSYKVAFVWSDGVSDSNVAVSSAWSTEAALPVAPSGVSASGVSAGEVEASWNTDVGDDSYDLRFRSTATLPALSTQTSAPWHLERLSQRTRSETGEYKYRYTGAGVRIYSVDTGIRATHEQFGGRVLAGFNATDAPDISDEYGHGTQTASSAAGSVSGIAKGATIVPVKVHRTEDPVTYYDNPTAATRYLSGLAWIAANHPAGVRGVVTCSLGAPNSASSTDVTNAWQALLDLGLVCVQALPNSGAEGYSEAPNTAYLPSKVIFVAGMGEPDTFSPYSNYGSLVDIEGPAQLLTDLASNTSDTATIDSGGNSNATPMVAGICALLLEENPHATVDRILEILLQQANNGVLASVPSGTVNRLAYSLVTSTDWVTHTGVTEPYTINGLEPGSEYEIEVRRTVSGQTSDWSAVALVETLAEASISAAQQVGNFGQTASVDHVRVVTAAQQVAAFAQTASAAATASVQASQQVGNFVQSASADHVRTLSSSQTVGAFSQTASAAAQATAQAAQQVSSFEQTSTAKVQVDASASQQVGDFSQSASIAIQDSRLLSASQTVGSFGQSATADVRNDATATQQVGTFGQTASAQATVSASASQQVGSFTQTATAVRLVGLSAEQQVGTFGQTAQANTDVAASADQQVGAFAQAANISITDSRSLSASQQVGGFAQAAAVSVSNDTLASGAPAGVAASAPAATGAGDAFANAAASASSAQAPQASAAVSAVAQAAAAAVRLAAAAASASGSAVVSAVAARVALSAPVATASGGAAGSGAPSVVSASSASASAAGAAQATAAPAAIHVLAPQAGAFAGTGTIASGTPASVSAQAPAATAAGDAVAAAEAAAAALSAVAAFGAGDASVQAAPSSMQVQAPQAVGDAAGTASGPLAGANTSPASGQATGSAFASGVPAVLQAYPPRASFAGFSVYLNDARKAVYPGSPRSAGYQAARRTASLLSPSISNKERP